MIPHRSSHKAIIIIDGANSKGLPVTYRDMEVYFSKLGIPCAIPWNTNTPIVLEFKIP